MNRAVLIFGLLLAIALPLSLLAGRVWLWPDATPNGAIILAELRLPRALLAVIVGAGSGATIIDADDTIAAVCSTCRVICVLNFSTL